MNHFASRRFWELYRALPENIRALADKNFALLEENRSIHHHFKKVGRFWTARVGAHYHRAIATQAGDDVHWHWIGSHAEYDALTK